MALNHTTAQRIVANLAPTVGTDLWIVDRGATLLAGTTPRLPLAATFPVEPPEKQRYRMLPLHCATAEVGALIIAISAEYGEELAQIAKTLADLIIHQSTVVEQLTDRQWALDKVVSDLLHGQFQTTSEVIVQEATLLEIDLTIPRIVIVINVQPCFVHLRLDPAAHHRAEPGYRVQRQQLRQRLLHQAQQHLPGEDRNLYAFLDEHWLVVLAAIDREKPDDECHRLKRKLQGLLDEINQSVPQAVSAGMSDYDPGWQQLPQAYTNARFALNVGSALLGAGQVFTVSALGLAAFVCAPTAAIPQKLATRLLSPLLDQPELLNTLDTFLQGNLCPSQAAQRLHIHRHTLAYRLQKIADLTGADPRNFQDATKLLAALLWHKLQPCLA